MSTKSANDNSFRFITFLFERKDNRAMLAHLRRGLGERMGHPDMYPYVVPFLPEQKNLFEAYFQLASWVGMHPMFSDKPVTMGSVFRQLPENDSRDKRFKALLDAQGEQFYYHQRQAISLAKAHDVAVNYHHLLKDMLNWSHPERFVQLQWARDFWAD